ncbi:FAD-dependent oxidoreductase [Candidatus Pacearchaeota archaeon]|nr:FAD-dependent oxidoreductase [Candidatus Pacearchaeota archaeon]
MKTYDVIIIGGGPAGLTAAIYSARYQLKTLVLSKDMGGIAATAHKICNYPSYTDISGMQLMLKFIAQVEDLKVPINYEEVLEISRKKHEFLVKSVKAEYKAKKIIFTGGAVRQKLNVPGEKEFLGKGVSYCATCDATFFKDKTVAVVGGSDAALTAALLLSEYAKRVYIIYRKDKFFRAEPTWIELVEKNKKIKIIFNDEITEIKGDNFVTEITLKSNKAQKVQGVFIEIGSTPKLTLIDDLNVRKTDRGYILTDDHQKTNVEGLLAAGDITNKPLKQIVTAAAQGATAAYTAYEEIKHDD